MTRRLVPLILAGALVGATALATTAASADTPGVACQVSGTIKFQPPLAVTAADVQYVLSLGTANCVTSGGAVAGTLAGSGSSGVKGLSCAGGDSQGSVTVTDANGAQVASAGFTASATGPLFIPNNGAYGTLVLAIDPTGCATSGVASASFTGSLVFPTAFPSP